MDKATKQTLTEQDICTKFITPALVAAGWDIQHQVREQYYFTKGRIIVRGKTIQRGEGKKVDYLLYYRSNMPIALIEAKDNKYEVGAGMQQGLDYAESLDIPFVFSSNGDGFIEHDKTGKSSQIERELTLEQFPSPEELYGRFLRAKGYSEQATQIVEEKYFYDPNRSTPRYYQEVAINRTIEAVAKGQQRALLVMATGTGKTYTSFQIIWRLWKSGTKKRILFLADRNILVDDPMRRDFAPLKDVMKKIDRSDFEYTMYSAYQMFFALYQSFTGQTEDQKVFKQFPPDFFDLIVIDECHRGSAADDSAWREILAYFKSATHVGLTATPKETKEISNIDYFGEPIYMYSLKQGIEDGFLAPYKVVRVTIDKDVEGFRPEAGQTDRYGEEIPDEVFTSSDFDNRMVIDDRTKLVAQKITEYLEATGDRFAKTIVFCVNIEHAERMRRALINLNLDLVNQNQKYIWRITGDSEEAKSELDNFIDPEKRFPVIVTTSKLLTTGVDAKTTKLVVLDSNIKSMIEFKQIIGRGTRIDEEFNKYYFTIMDFRQATKLFADPDFDGPPVMIKEVSGKEPIPEDIGETLQKEENGQSVDSVETLVSPDEAEGTYSTVLGAPPKLHEPMKKYYVDGVNVSVLNVTVQFLDESGKLVTESVKEYSRKKILATFRTLDEFINKWNTADQKSAVVTELEEKGVFFDELKKDVGKDYDPFDMVLHLAYGRPALTRKERARKVKKESYFDKYGEKAKQVLDALLDKYADQGISAVESLEVLKVPPIEQFGTPLEILQYFGGKEQYMQALNEFKKVLYG